MSQNTNGRAYPKICGEEIFDFERLLVEDLPPVKEHNKETSH